MKDLGSLSYFLGLDVISTDNGIYLSQTKYASDFLARAGITDSCTESTPLEPNVHFTPMDDTVLDNHTLYRQLVGVLVYLTVTRPYIAYPTYSDADWAGDPTDHRSTTCYCLFLGDSHISCAIQIAHNDVFHESTKHIEIDDHFVRQHILIDVVRLIAVGTLDQTADIFMKAHHLTHFGL
ncbi:uncharacterized protein LOC107616155 [Arachis ipaensis]|uniref:uncharacterized protein LOC107616155 n=1 Tax=Arachis ipaensis TaxID=130454 RepID=UPI0007AF02F3|nr:uncharacterized protein LOC107616155 [Arachis ipaensis]